MLKVVKIGGNIVDNPAKLREFLAGFAAMEGDKILVHGGGKIATSIAAALGIETRMIEGRRVTDERTLDVVTMVYNGINKQIVSALQALGCDAVGLCGADGKLIVSKKRPPVSVGSEAGGAGCSGGETVDYGFVGDPVAVNTALVKQLVGQGLTLVVAPITYDGGGDSSSPGGLARNDRGRGSLGTTHLLNTNADTVAQTLATAMATAYANDDVNTSADRYAVELVYCFEKQGVMLDVDNENSLIERIDREKFKELKSAGKVHGGMLAKLENAFAALGSGVRKVVICAAENLSKPGYAGTTIVK